MQLISTATDDQTLKMWRRASLGLPSDWPWWAKSGIPWFYCWSKGGTRCFVWWNKSFMIYVWWYVQVHDVYTDATLFCNRPVLFKNILHELGPRPQEDSPQTVSPQADDGDIGTSTEADGDWRQLELNLDSLWMGRGNPPFFFFNSTYTWRMKPIYTYYVEEFKGAGCSMAVYYSTVGLRTRKRLGQVCFQTSLELCVSSPKTCWFWCWMFQDSAEFIHTACSNHVGPNGFWEPYCALGVGGLRGEIIIPA